MQFEVIKINTVQTEKEGLLSFFESEKTIPFQIKRIYYISNVPAGARRGAHAHKALKQLLFCPYGSVTIFLDNGNEKAQIELDDPSKGLVIYPGLWRDMLWNVNNSVLCVAASEYYDESDYIRNYEDFLAYLEAQKGAKEI